MKKVLKQLFGGIVDNYFISQAFKKIKKLNTGSKVFFFDIDNTIADTQGAKHLTNVKPFPKMISLVKEKSKLGVIFFITARNITSYRSTSTWLTKMNFTKNEMNLIFLTHPEIKIKVLNAAVSQGLVIEYYDDLCYNHENGEIKKYETVIKDITTLKITYKGIDDFRHLQH